MLRVGVLVSGNGTNLQALLDLEQNVYKIVTVVSSKPGAYALERARASGLEALCKNGAEELIKHFKSRSVGLIVTAGYLKILAPEFVRAFEGRIINIHPALCPSFCGRGFYGLRVHSAVLEYGARITGATVHYVDEGIDSGRIISQKAVEVLPGDTPEVLQKRVMEQAERVLLPDAVVGIAIRGTVI